MQRNRITSTRARLLVLALAAAAAPAATPAGAQGTAAATRGADTTSRFQAGRLYAGPRLWLGNLNGAIAIGGQVERGFTAAGKYGPGVIAAGVGVDYYSWSQRFGTPLGTGSWKYSVIPVQLFGNYHFTIAGNRKLDPYLGVALVYSHYNTSWSGPFAAPSGASASTTGIAGQGGLRYFVSDKLAVQGQLGFGYGTLGLGATWKL